MLKFLAILLLIAVCVVARHTSRSIESNKLENYETDSIIDFLLNGYLTEDEQEIEKSDRAPEIPEFTDGVWKYGICDNVANTRPIYTEFYDIEKDKSVKGPIVIQVELSADNMRCVTINADSSSKVVKVDGSIKESSVTFSVSNSYQFIVHVY